eukprot:02381.XXX_27273_27431_1 [CDS] Oithona nana genome sequencing.
MSIKILLSFQDFKAMWALVILFLVRLRTLVIIFVRHFTLVTNILAFFCNSMSD